MKVGIVEDQVIYERYLADIVTERCGFEVVATCKDGLEAVDLCSKNKTDLVILDLRIPRLHGLEVAARLLQELPRVKILAFSGEVNRYNVRLVESLGIPGYLDKGDHVMDDDRFLVDAIMSVANGDRCFSPNVERISKELANDSDAYHKLLSPKKVEILRLIGMCMTDKEIAEMLGKTVFTIRKHRSEIMQHLSLDSTVALIRYAQKAGLSNQSIDKQYQ